MNDFDEKIENNESQNGLTNKQKFYFVLSYIPFLNFVLYFNEINPKPKNLDKFKTQGMVIFILFVVGYFVLSFIGLQKIFFLIYLCFVGFMSFKAYNGEYFEIEFIEKIIKNFKK